MEERATCPHSNALSGTSGSGIVAGQKKAADLTGLPVPIISTLVDGLMHMARTNIDKRSRLLGAARLPGRDVLLRAPQGGRPGGHQSERDIRSTPGLDRKPVSGTRKGERLQRPCRAPAFRHARRFGPGSYLS